MAALFPRPPAARRRNRLFRLVRRSPRRSWPKRSRAKALPLSSSMRSTACGISARSIAGIGAVARAGASPLVRVPLNDFALVSRALDFGAEAIIAPMINSAADARRFAAAAKYPPLGERSWGPLRAMTLQGRDRADRLSARGQ